jgi:hypothetical protein
VLCVVGTRTVAEQGASPAGTVDERARASHAPHRTRATLLSAPLSARLQGFSADRIAGGIAKLKKARSGGSQMRMDSFFKSVPSSAPPAAAGVKRKADEPKPKGGAGGGKKGKK